MTPALIVRDLVVTYPGSDNPAVAGLSLTAQPGRVTALLGPNGAGKTSTLECCVGLRHASGGEIEILGRHGVGLRTAAHRSEVGVMLQDGGLPASARPIPLLRHLAALYADPWPVQDLVQRLGIDSFASTRVRQLSGGQRQRVALAAAVVGRPWLAFLDEPTAGLDPQTKLAVNEVIAGLVADGVAVVLTTHDMAQAQQLADQVFIIDQGRCVAAGAPSQLTAGSRPRILLTLDREVDTESLALPPDAALTHDPPGRYEVTGDVGPYALVAVARWLAGAGVVPRELHLRERTLEDVFLELTGRELR